MKMRPNAARAPIERVFICPRFIAAPPATMEPVPGRGQCLHEIPGPKRFVPEEEDRVAAVLGELPGQRFGVVGIWFMIAAVFIGFSDTLRSYGHARRSRTARARGLA